VKRPLDAIEAVARLGPHARLLTVGTGELEARARAEAKQRGLHVTWAGFLNQSELGRAYAVADCLVLPSTTETWGLVVNEALATGLPCVVSDQVGCAPDLITEGETGAIFPVGNVSALAAALRGVWKQRQDQYDFATACRVRVARYSFAVATAGLRAACQSVLSPHQPVTVAETAPQAPRIIACCGGMVIVSGLERMTFEVLRVAREQGAAVHCILNTWENQRIMQLVEQINASWSTGYYWYRLDRHTRNPFKLAQIGWDICRTSLGLLCEARRFQPTHVLVPEFASAVRNAPALLWLRRRGVGIVLRVANVPDDGEFYARLWGQWLPRVVSQFVAISQRCEERLQALGISKRQIRVIRNCVAQRSVAADADADVVALVRRQPTLLYVGQLAPFKGVHIVVEATRALRAAGYDLQTVLVGRIPEWPPEFVAYVDRLRDAADNDNAAPAIHLVGERQNVLEIMRQSYVLGVPSLGEEGLGNVALEARQVGLPVVAFPAGGLRELVEHKVTGYLCDTADLASFVAGVRFFLDNPEARAQASATSIASFTDPECDFTAAQFRKRWWKLWTESRSVKHDL
jgi:glycosyltransferase involved in cell wall biosynthesis